MRHMVFSRTCCNMLAFTVVIVLLSPATRSLCALNLVKKIVLLNFYVTPHSGRFTQ
jgi:hypothetical protein